MDFKKLMLINKMKRLSEGVDGVWRLGWWLQKIKVKG